MVAYDTRAVLQHWWDPHYRSGILYKRRTMRVSLKMYLNKVPSVAGAEGNPSDHVPVAASLANAYRAMVKAQAAPSTNNIEQAQWIGWMISPLFSEIWRDVCSIQIPSRSVPKVLVECLDDAREGQAGRVGKIVEFAAGLTAAEVVNWEAQEAVATANLLADAYVKSCAELKAILAARCDDNIVLQHHSTLLSQNVSDMLTLLLEGAWPGTTRLPDDHVHRIAADAQLQSRAPATESPHTTIN